MSRWIGIAAGILSPVAGFLGTHFYFKRKTRRKAEESRPKIEALLDEMIRLVTVHKSSLEKIVGTNSMSTVNDERRNRDLSLHVAGDAYSLDLTTLLVGRKAGCVSVRVHRSRGDASLHLYWPDIAEYWPMEPWLKERFDRLDALVGKTSRWDRLKRRFPHLGDDDEGTPTVN